MTLGTHPSKKKKHSWPWKRKCWKNNYFKREKNLPNSTTISHLLAHPIFYFYLFYEKADLIHVDIFLKLLENYLHHEIHTPGVTHPLGIYVLTEFLLLILGFCYAPPHSQVSPSSPHFPLASLLITNPFKQLLVLFFTKHCVFVAHDHTTHSTERLQLWWEFYPSTHAPNNIKYISSFYAA